MITDQDIREATLYINDVDVYQAVGALLQSYTVGATAVTNEVYQGVDSTSFNVLSTLRGMRTINLVLFYSAQDRRGLALKKAEIDNMLSGGKLDLYLPDRFHYMAYLTSAGDEQLLGVEGNELIASCSYSFQGIRHDALERLTIASEAGFICRSLIPLTDCRITVTASQAYASLTIGSVTVTSVAKDDVITVDGINKRILQNGAPCAGNMSFVNFPKLVPGLNTIDCVEQIELEYYPTY